MLQVKVQDKTFFVPEKWEEVSVKQFADLDRFRAELNPARVMSIFTGIDYGWILNADPKEIEVKLLSCMHFLGSDVDVAKFVRPDYILIAGRRFDVPKAIRNETYGQKMYIQELVNDGVKRKLPIYDLIPMALAIYFQPAFDDKPFDDKRAEALKPMMSHLPICDAYPVAGFFLKKYIQLLNKKSKN